MHYLGQQKTTLPIIRNMTAKQKGAIIILGEIYTDIENSDVEILGVFQWTDSTNFLQHFQLEDKLSTWRNLNSSVLQKN